MTEAEDLYPVYPMGRFFGAQDLAEYGEIARQVLINVSFAGLWVRSLGLFRTFRLLGFWGFDRFPLSTLRNVHWRRLDASLAVIARPQPQPNRGVREWIERIQGARFGVAHTGTF